MLYGDLLRLSAARHPDKTALIGNDARLSFRDLDRAANRYANAILGRGFAKGDCIAVLSRNVPEYAALAFGNARTGTLLCNLAPQMGEREILHILETTKPRLLIVEGAVAGTIAPYREKLPHVEEIVAIGATDAFEATPYETFLGDAKDAPPGVALSPDDPFTMTFTGGTTGFPKGTLVSHRARVASSYICAFEHELTARDVTAVVTPMYHAIGGTIWFPSVVLAGATCVLIEAWDAGGFIERVARHGVSSVMMVPVQVRQMMADGVFDAAKLASLKTLVAGGASTAVDLIRDVEARLPETAFIDHYGQSETGLLSLFKAWHPRDKAGSVGQAAVGVELDLRAPDGSSVAAGEVGEVVVRGDFMMTGYYKNPEETAGYFKQGDDWGWTGDLGVMDEDGFLSLVGRSKEMIVSGGVNVYPREVEITLETHEAVTDCTVFGIPHDKWGESVVAYVVLRDGAALDEGALIEYCASQLGRYKRPSTICFVEAIPKTPAGKVRKPILREEFLKSLASG